MLSREATSTYFYTKFINGLSQRNFVEKFVLFYILLKNNYDEDEDKDKDEEAAFDTRKFIKGLCVNETFLKNSYRLFLLGLKIRKF